MKAFAGAIAVALLSVAAAHATIITYQSGLSGAAEVPPVVSAGTGAVTVTVDTVANTLSIAASFSGLTTGTTASHIHCCTAAPLTGNAGVATQLPAFLNMPLGVTSGSFTQTLDLLAASTYNPAFVTLTGSVASAESTLLAGMAAGETYFNIHTTQNPGGEIRGFLTVPTPEPGTWLLVGIAMAGLTMRRKFICRS